MKAQKQEFRMPGLVALAALAAGLLGLTGPVIAQEDKALSMSELLRQVEQGRVSRQQRESQGSASLVSVRPKTSSSRLLN